MDLDDNTIVKRRINAAATPVGEWTIQHVKQCGHLLLCPAILATDNTFPRRIGRKQADDPIVGRLIWAWHSLM